MQVHSKLGYDQYHLQLLHNGDDYNLFVYRHPTPEAQLDPIRSGFFDEESLPDRTGTKRSTKDSTPVIICRIAGDTILYCGDGSYGCSDDDDMLPDEVLFTIGVPCSINDLAGMMLVDMFRGGRALSPVVFIDHTHYRCHFVIEALSEQLDAVAVAMSYFPDRELLSTTYFDSTCSIERGFIRRLTSHIREETVPATGISPSELVY